MEFKKLMSAVALMGAMTVAGGTASANTGAAAAFDAYYIEASSCTLCHTAAPGLRTTVGIDWLAAGGSKDAGPTDWAAFNAASGSVYTPDPNYVPPTSGGGGGGCVTSSIATPLSMALAMLTLGFFVRRKKD